MPTPPGSSPASLSVALTIAGSDSGGGAGIQADLKTFHAFGVFGTSAVTAITAQNTLGVTAIHPVPAAVVRAQIDAVAVDLHPRALKTGMLATAELVETVADSITAHGPVPCVMDPVMVSASGHRLLEAEAEATLARRLLPLATLVTPNLDEAALLTGSRVDSLAAMRTAAGNLIKMGAGAALVKGGHLPSGEAADVFRDETGERVWRRPRIATGHVHGTGCTLAAAVTAGLARGVPLPQAVEVAIDFVARAIASAPGLGAGGGPINHFARPRTRGTATNVD